MNRIFISSTFCDMQAERDAIQKQIVPKLRARAREYGDDIEFIDLRWGVNTGNLDTETGAKKILSVCLDEIERCRPFMIVLLGERYGWIPDSETMRSVTIDRDIALDELEESITALEIEYGALKDSKMLENTIFMFRKPLLNAPATYKSESAKHARKLEDLKNRIRRMGNARIFEYEAEWSETKGSIENLDEFIETLTNGLLEIFESRWQQFRALSETTKQIQKQWAWIHNRARLYGERSSLVNKAADALQRTSHLVLVHGARGSECDSISARLLTEKRDEGWLVIPFVCDVGERNTTGLDVLKFWVSALEETLSPEQKEAYHHEAIFNPLRLESTENEGSEWRIRLILLQRKYLPKDKPVLFALLNAGNIESDMRDEYNDYIPVINERNVHFLISRESANPSTDFPGTILEVPMLSDDEIGSFLQSRISHYGKELDPSVIEAVQRKPSCRIPLYLDVISEALLSFDVEDFRTIAETGNDEYAINRYIVGFIDRFPDDTPAACKALIERICKKGNPDLASAIVKYIAISPVGLRESDLRALAVADGLDWSDLDFARIMNFSSHFFEDIDGRFDFSSEELKGIAAAELDASTNLIHLADYIKRLPHEDSLRMDTIVHFCYITDDKEFLVQYMIDCCAEASRELPWKQTPPTMRELVRDVLASKYNKWCAEAMASITDRNQAYTAFEFVDVYLNEGCKTKPPKTHEKILDMWLSLHKAFVALSEDFKQDNEFEWQWSRFLLALGCLTYHCKAYRSCVNFLNQAASLVQELYKSERSYGALFAYGTTLFWLAKGLVAVQDFEQALSFYRIANSLFDLYVSYEEDPRMLAAYGQSLYEEAICCWKMKDVAASEKPCRTALTVFNALFKDLDLESGQLSGFKGDMGSIKRWRCCCEMLSFALDCKGDGYRAANLQEVLAVDGLSRRLDNLLRYLAKNPLDNLQYAIELKDFSKLCKSVGYGLEQLHCDNIIDDLLLTAIKNGGDYRTEEKYKRNCENLVELYKGLGALDFETVFELGIMKFYKRIALARPFLPNIGNFREHCEKVVQLYFEQGDLWAARQGLLEILGEPGGEEEPVVPILDGESDSNGILGSLFGTTLSESEKWARQCLQEVTNLLNQFEWSDQDFEVAEARVRKLFSADYVFTGAAPINLFRS